MDLYFDAERVQKAKKHGLPVTIDYKTITDRDYEKLALMENDASGTQIIDQKTDLKFNNFKIPAIKKLN